MTRETLRLDGRIAMITGAARGMGREHALLMAERGADLILNDLDADVLARTAEDCRALGRTVTELACDNTDIGNFTRLIGEHEAEHGRVDILVNNAGIQGNKYTVEEIDEEIWEAMTFIKMKATFFAARAVIPGMKKRKYGKLINVSSIFAMEGSFSMSHYTGAASGVLGYAKGWASGACALEHLRQRRRALIPLIAQEEKGGPDVRLGLHRRRRGICGRRNRRTIVGSTGQPGAACGSRTRHAAWQ